MIPYIQYYILEGMYRLDEVYRAHMSSVVYYRIQP